MTIMAAPSCSSSVVVLAPKEPHPAFNVDQTVDPAAPLPDGIVPQCITLVGIQDAFAPWWSAQDTLSKLQTLYQARCLSYPRTDSEIFPSSWRQTSREWVDQASEVFRHQGWAMPRVDDWAPNPALFDDNRLDAHTGIHPIFEQDCPVVGTLKALSPDLVMVYRAVVLGFVRRCMDPAVLSRRLDLFELNRTLAQVSASLNDPWPQGPARRRL